MMRLMPRRPVRPILAAVILSTSAVVLTGPAVTAASAAGQRPTPGAAGIGDRLYPGLGNGGYDALHYDLSLRYATSSPSQSIDGTEVLTARSTQALSRFNLDFAGSGITSVTVNGAAARFVHDHQELVITPKTPIAKGAVFKTKIKHFTATPTKPGAATSTVAFTYSKDGSVTAGQPDGEHYVYPSNDHPRDKASFTFRFDVPAGTTAVANGVLTKQRTTGGRSYLTYRQHEPMATELTQLAVGKYTVLKRKPVNGVAVRDVIPTRLLADYRDKLGIEREQIAWMEDKVGPYPFDLYGTMITTAPIDFALETQGLSVFDQVFFTKSPVGYWKATMTHELAHQWFGDDVAPFEWSDIWLNEGHATWYETTYAAEKGFLKDDYKIADFTELMKSFYAAGDQYRADYGPVALLTDGSVEEQFNPNVYEGGALVLYALQQKIGKAAFAKVERAWVSKYSGKAASTDDFISLASKVSGEDLVNFLGAWVYGKKTPPMPGHPDWKVDRVTSSVTASTAFHQNRSKAFSG